MKKLEGICPACLVFNDLTRHHVFPKRNHGRYKNDTTITLCPHCHKQIERMLKRNPTKEECVVALISLISRRSDE